jgi:hypothetical protein
MLRQPRIIYGNRRGQGKEVKQDWKPGKSEISHRRRPGGLTETASGHDISVQESRNHILHRDQAPGRWLLVSARNPIYIIIAFVAWQRITPATA